MGNNQELMTIYQEIDKAKPQYETIGDNNDEQQCSTNTKGVLERRKGHTSNIA